MAGEDLGFELPAPARLQDNTILLEFRDRNGRVWNGAAMMSDLHSLGMPALRLADAESLELRLIDFKVVQ